MLFQITVHQIVLLPDLFVKRIVGRVSAKQGIKQFQLVFVFVATFQIIEVELVFGGLQKNKAVHYRLAVCGKPDVFVVENNVHQLVVAPPQAIHARLCIFAELINKTAVRGNAHRVNGFVFVSVKIYDRYFTFRQSRNFSGYFKILCCRQKGEGQQHDQNCLFCQHVIIFVLNIPVKSCASKVQKYG